LLYSEEHKLPFDFDSEQDRVPFDGTYGQETEKCIGQSYFNPNDENKGVFKLGQSSEVITKWVVTDEEKFGDADHEWFSNIHFFSEILSLLCVALFLLF